MKKKARKLIALLFIGFVSCLLFGCKANTKELDNNTKVTVTEDGKKIEILSDKNCTLELNVTISEDDIRITGEKRIYLQKGKKETLKVNDFGEAIRFPESAIFSKINSVQVEEKKLENTIIYVAVGVAVVILITIAIKKEIKNNFKVSE